MPAAAPAADVSGPIPVLDSLDAIYGAGERHAPAARVARPSPPSVSRAGDASTAAAIRLGKLTEAFKAEFGGVEPTVCVRRWGGGSRRAP